MFKGRSAVPSEGVDAGSGEASSTAAGATGWPFACCASSSFAALGAVLFSGRLIMSTSSFAPVAPSRSMLDAPRLSGEADRGNSGPPPITARCETETRGDWFPTGERAARTAAGPGSDSNISSTRSLSRDRSVEAATGELAADELQSVAAEEPPWVCSRGGRPEGGPESPRT